MSKTVIGLDFAKDVRKGRPYSGAAAGYDLRTEYSTSNGAKIRKGLTLSARHAQNLKIKSSETIIDSSTRLQWRLRRLIGREKL